MSRDWTESARTGHPQFRNGKRKKSRKGGPPAEAENLVKRLLQPHSSIENWDIFRYNVLPQALAPYRVALERLLIRDFAAILKNKRDIPWRDLAGCCSANEKIDR